MTLSKRARVASRETRPRALRRPRPCRGHSRVSWRRSAIVPPTSRTSRSPTRTLGGDLYHYPQERTLRRPPPDTEFNVQQSAASRVMINANADLFAGSTWLARPAERAFMWEEGNTRVNRTFFDKIRDSRSISLDKDEYDAFGDGTVILKAAPGHSPGHQVLVLNLPATGRIMLAGDLYHYPQERTLRRPPPDTEFNVQQSAASRVMIEEYLKQTKTEIWIEHDFVANAKLKKSPAYYD